MTAHPNTLQLHQLRYGELDAAHSAEIRAHLDTCEMCRSRFQAQEAARAAFVVEPVPAAIRAAAPPPARAPWWSWVAIGSLVGVAAIASIVVGPSLMTGDGTRSKGERVEVEVWVADGAGERPIHAGERLGEGDRVQVKVDPHGAAWLGLAGRDGTGKVEVYGGFSPDHDGLQPVPFALTLDDAPGPQEIFVVKGAKELREAEVVAAVKTQAGVVERVVVEKR